MSDITTQQQYLTFTVSADAYAIGILRVKEIIAYDFVTRVPRTPDFIRGVINLRGSVVPVIDLAMKFGYGEIAPTGSTCIVIVEVDLEGKPVVMGLMVDAVDQVIDLAEADIQETPSFGTQVSVEFLVGMGRYGKSFVLILDIDKVLATNEIITAVESANEAAEPSAEPELVG